MRSLPLVSSSPFVCDVAVVGGGPAGLMAAQVLTEAGYAVHVFDAMPSVGRKFLLAGKGGLNLTHSEDTDRFVARYGSRSAAVAAWLAGFSPQDLRAWAQRLGVDTFVGSSGRVFPVDMKAAPLLRAWLQALRHPSQGHGVAFHMRHRWLGWRPDGALVFETPGGEVHVQARAQVLALGGGSWARLGSTGAWQGVLQDKGVALSPLRPANCGFDVEPGWSDFFASRFAGGAFKSVALCVDVPGDQPLRRKGEFVATRYGVEGSLIYAVSSLLREAIAREGAATFHVDLLPDVAPERVLAEVSHPRGSRSLSSHLKSRLHLDGIKSALLHELLPKAVFDTPVQLAQAIKALPVTVRAPRPLDEAISSAGGVCLEALTSDLMLSQMPGIFCAGEMLDWEAPTGGYLLQACFASGWRAGHGACAYLAQPHKA